MLTATADRPVAPVASTGEGGVRATERTLPASSFIAFRIAFGLLVAIGQIRFLARGWVDEFYLSPTHHLTYPGFEWVRPLPPVLMYATVVVMALAGCAIAVGFRTRVAAGLFAVLFGYCELIDAGLYLNHYWFMTLAAVVLAVVPGPRGGRVPAISVWALRGQLGVVYFFAGLAKVNSDWLFRAEPLQTWLAARTDRPLIGPWLGETVVAFAFSWAGAVFDLTIVAWLLWRRSRPVAYGVLVVFHVATAMLFQIGLFPWVMIALTPIFFAPTWPDRWLRRRAVTAEAGAVAEPGSKRRVRAGLLVALAVMAVANVAVPMRHVLADGNVRWNDDGYLLSWRVMLTERASHVTFHVSDPSAGSSFDVDAEQVLDEWQAAAAMVRADLILTSAHLLADEFRPVLGDDVEVRVDAFVAWNGRLPERWIDPVVDLAALPRTASANAYVLDAP